MSSKVWSGFEYFLIFLLIFVSFLFHSGLDVVAVLEYLNLSDSVLAGKVGTGASTFVIA